MKNNNDSIKLNEELPFSIELVEDDKNSKTTDVKEMVDSKSTQVDEENQPWYKKIIKGKSGEKHQNSLLVVDSSVLEKIKVRFKNITEGITKFFKEAASLASQKKKLDKAARGIEESKGKLKAKEEALAKKERALDDAGKDLAARKEQFDKARREEFGFKENVPEDRLKAEEYMCERFRRLNCELRHYYQTYLNKDSQIQVDDSEKKRMMEKLRGKLIAELALLSGILDSNEILIFSSKTKSPYTFKILKEDLLSESKWFEGQACEEMEIRYNEGIKGMIELGIFQENTCRGYYFNVKKIVQELSQETRNHELHCHTNIFDDRYLDTSDGVRRYYPENPVHEIHQDISETVENVMGFIAENDSER